MKPILHLTLLAFAAVVAQATEFHVATNGADSNPGTKRAPFRTIQHAAERAQPGDTITVHAGIYRERVNPPRGGTSDRKRIVYQAAPGEKVVITGAEPARGWVKVTNDTWQLVVPNSFFGNFNPYSDLIRGDWFQSKGRKHHTGAVYLNGDWLTEAAKREAVMRPAGSNSLWFATVEAAHTTIWAQFPGVNPNSANVEINVRQTVFYPDQPGRNYITVRGFTLRQAATPWAPPTAEQIGLIGTHWSKGWIIEDNIVSHSTCSGIALGKHGDKFDNTSANSAEGYIKTIERAHAHSIPWTKENIGHHLVRNSAIAHCEQAGIVGSLGAIFSTITGNVIHDIHVRQLFTGDEQAGIKLHGAIDTTISRNHIFRANRGIWLDWMAQGARVSANLLHDNNSEEDLFLEVNHGPCVVDYNIFLSPVNVRNVSEGSAFVQNLFTGKIVVQPDRGRATPFHPPHNTTVADVAVILGGDDRFYNNIFIGNGTAGAESAKAAPQQTPRGAGYGLWVYDQQAAPPQTGGNVMFHRARSYAQETNVLVRADRNPGVALIQRDGRFLLRADFDQEHEQAVTMPGTTALLGKVKIPNAAYVNPDGSPLKLNTDYFGRKHDGKKPFAGPFADAMNGREEIEVWPRGLRAAAGPAAAAEDELPWGGGAGDAWLKAARAQVLTPTTDRVVPVAVQRQEGAVESAEALLAEDGRSARLSYPEDGAKPVVVLDFGAQSVGGFAVFKVTAKTGEPVLRLTYACHPDGTGETGDFTRETSARYMGPAVDLPVLPANINRHETYAIPRTGVFIAPLIQGQARYVRVQLDRPGTSVDIDSVAMVNREVHDRAPYDGLFLCSNEQINRLWYISAWTYQIASFPNHDAWRAVDGWLLPRKLEQAADIGLSVDGADWGDVTIETVFEIRANPHHVSTAGLAFRARDAENAYMVELALDGTFRMIKRENGQDRTLSEKMLASPLTDGMRYRLKIETKGDLITTWLDDVMVDETRDGTFATGRVGFYTPKEKWPLFEFIQVSDRSGGVLFEDDFSGDLSRWEFSRTRSFVSDGGKRDRLVWSGDLYFAQRLEYYAKADASYMRDSLKMLAFNQTPEGYVQACPYPERNTPPASGEYGPFASDEFAAWLVPVAWDHLLYTDDVETLRGIYPAIGRLLVYLEKHIGDDGLFIQRHETSKQAGDLKLGNTKRRAYMNILCWAAFSDAAKIADRLGHADDAAAALAKAHKIKAALFQHLWDEKNVDFHEAVETPRFGPLQFS